MCNLCYLYSLVKMHCGVFSVHFCVFLRCFDTVGWVIWPVKTRPHMTYNVFDGTLSLTQSINQSAVMWVWNDAECNALTWINVCWQTVTLWSHSSLVTHLHRAVVCVRIHHHPGQFSSATALPIRFVTLALCTFVLDVSHVTVTACILWQDKTVTLLGFSDTFMISVGIIPCH